MTITYRQDVLWHNFHRTIGDQRDERARLFQMVAECAEVTPDNASAEGLAQFAAHARDVFSHLEYLLARMGDTATGDAGLQGAAWSFAPLVGNKDSVFDCATIKTLALAAPDDLAAVSRESGRIAFVGGGNTLDELTAWSEPQGLSIRTSGTFLHSTLAGSVATASHGSRLDYGGIQNMVCGMHLVVAPGVHCWVERASEPVLSDKALAALSAAGASVTLVRDDRHFENALVHLGAMGVVVGLAMQLIPDRRYAPLRLAKPIDDPWMRQLEQGNFQDLARQHGVDHDPQFYELTIEPTKAFGTAALHIWYFHADQGEVSDDVKQGNTAKAYSGLAEKTLAPIANRVPDLLSALTAVSFKNAPAAPDPADVARALKLVLMNHESAFDYYRKTSGFLDAIGDFDPGNSQTKSGSWRALHQGEITTGQPGALYNASFAVARGRTREAVDAICAAVADLPPIFLFTLRFVSQPAGTLAFTRFQENTVIEIDGLSPLAMDWASLLAASDPNTAPLVPVIKSIRDTTLIGARRVRKALSDARIEYSMHWAKLGELDGDKVVADFGTSEDSDLSLIQQWQETRRLLVPEHTRHLFANAAIRSYRLI